MSDAMTVRSALERYEDLDLNFHGSREGNLLKVSLIPKHSPPLPHSTGQRMCKPVQRHRHCSQVDTMWQRMRMRRNT